MHSTPGILDILHHTPAWVWALLAGLVALGLVQAAPRRVGLQRVALLPLAMLAWSLAGAGTTFAAVLAPLALPAWALGAVASAAVTARRGPPPGARWSAAAGCLDLPGSWLPLALILALFGLKFALGAALALDPALRADTALAAAASLAFGAASGVFAGRALALLRLARRPVAARLA